MSANSKKVKIGIIGCGHMGSSFAKHLGAVHELFLVDRTLEKAQKVAGESGGIALKSAAEVVKHAEIIILAVKPQNLITVAHEIKGSLSHHQLLVSLLAGVPVRQLKHHFGNVTLLRMMPNLAVKYQKGVIGLCEYEVLPKEMKQRIELLFSPFGAIYWLPEDKMDALTSLTGSGPAFAFVMIEAMVEAGITMGFSSSQSLQMVLEMLKGSIQILEETGKHPAELKWQVSSPAGTTMAGLNRLERENVRYGIISTFLDAQERAKEISKHIIY
jgi:pyrroline-5-carboxylate reductase